MVFPCHDYTGAPSRRIGELSVVVRDGLPVPWRKRMRTHSHAAERVTNRFSSVPRGPRESGLWEHTAYEPGATHNVSVASRRDQG